jgi:very-short-patch-repair endonuclease
MRGQTSPSILHHKLQRNLRRGMTRAERYLWRYLRERQINGARFRRQHPFKNYVLDFVCIEQMLVIEVDGGHHMANAAADQSRTRDLENAGFQVLRFWNNEVMRDIEGVVSVIAQTLQSPSPPRSSP